MASDEDIQKWTVDDVALFLSDFGFSSAIVQRFKEEEIDGGALLLLDQSDLKDELGLKLGPRKKLLQRLESFKSHNFDKKPDLAGLQDGRTVSSPGQSTDGNLPQEYGNATRKEHDQEMDDVSSDGPVNNQTKKDTRAGTTTQQIRPTKIFDDVVNEAKLNKSTTKLNVELREVSYEETSSTSLSLKDNIVSFEVDASGSDQEKLVLSDMSKASNSSLSAENDRDKQEPLNTGTTEVKTVRIDASDSERQLSCLSASNLSIPSTHGEERQKHLTTEIIQKHNNNEERDPERQVPVVSVSNYSILPTLAEKQKSLATESTQEHAANAEEHDTEWRVFDVSTSDSSIPLINRNPCGDKQKLLMNNTIQEHVVNHPERDRESQVYVATASNPNIPPTLGGDKQESSMSETIQGQVVNTGECDPERQVSVASASNPNIPTTLGGDKQESLTTETIQGHVVNTGECDPERQVAVASASTPNIHPTLGGEKQESLKTEIIQVHVVKTKERDPERQVFVASDSNPNIPPSLGGDKQESLGTEIIQGQVVNTGECDPERQVSVASASNPNISLTLGGNKQKSLTTETTHEQVVNTEERDPKSQVSDLLASHSSIPPSLGELNQKILTSESIQEHAANTWERDPERLVSGVSAINLSMPPTLGSEEQKPVVIETIQGHVVNIDESNTKRRGCGVLASDTGISPTLCCDEQESLTTEAIERDRIEGQEMTPQQEKEISSSPHSSYTIPETCHNITLHPTEKLVSDTNERSTCGSPKKDLTAQCVDYLQQINVPITFKLIDQEASIESTECTISNLHLHNERNDLEKAFTFIVITKGNARLSSDNSRILWNAICKQQIAWFNLLPVTLKEPYYIDDNEIYRKNSSEVIRIRPGKVDQVKLRNLVKRPARDTLFVMVVEESLMPKDSLNCYFRIEERGRKHIEFELDEKSRTHAAFQIGTLDKHGLRLTPYLQQLEKKRLASESKQIKRRDVQMPAHIMKENPREFETIVGFKTYTRSYQLNCNETGAKDLLEPIHEFKLFRCSNELRDKAILYFVDETLRFACACLNSRTNGTIHFGIADGNPQEAAKFDHFSKEIVGVPVQMQDVFIDKLNEYIRKCFVEHSTVMQCVRPPVFVPVRHQQSEEKIFVIEVDVVPSANYCKGIFFKVSLPKEGKSTQVPYFRDGASSKRLEGEDLLDKIKLLESLDEQRKLKEIKHDKTTTNYMNQKSLHMKLQKLVCRGRRKLDKSVYPLLVLSKPGSGETDQAEANLDFIKSIDWKVVVDFDDAGVVRDGVFTAGEHLQYSTVCAEDFEDEFLVNNLLSKPCWIWGNGSERDAKKALEYREWRSSERNKSLTKVIQHLATELPLSRVVVVFLLLSKHYREGSVVFGEFCTQFKGPNQLLFIAENEDIASPWMHELSEQYLTENQLLERSVIGMSWSEVNQSMKQFGSVTVEKDMLLPSPNGSSIGARREAFNPDVIYPLGMKDCRKLQTLSRKAQENLSSEEELRFYSGSQVTWNNLWFTDNGFNHVLRRSKLDEIVHKTKLLLQKPPREGRVFTLNLLHEVGAGASTLGRHVLWSFSQSEPYLCRCCVISQINDNTMDEILLLRQYKCDDSEHILPVLAFVDNIDDNLFDHFFVGMGNKAQELPKSLKPVVVFIQTKECIMAPEEEEDTTVTLRQQLDDTEMQWFQHKFSEMSKAYDDEFETFEKYATENLISFMIMKENFNPEYGRSVVRRSLSNANKDEQQLMKYLSLLCFYDQHPVFTAAFDSLMLSPEFQKKKYFRQWLSDLTPSTRVLLKECDMSGHFGTGTAIAIVHPLIANAVIDIVTSSTTTSVADIALEFLHSPALANDKWFPSQHLRMVTSFMLTHRKKYQYGDESQSAFAPLIEKILYGSPPTISPRSKHTSSSDKHVNKEDIEKVKLLFLRGLELFKEPGIAQQLARLFYLHASTFMEETDIATSSSNNALAKCFSEALKYASHAIEMAPNNAYLMDTVGRIYKKKFEMLFSSKTCKMVSIAQACDAIELALHGIEWFRKAQATSRNDKSDSIWGYFAELSMMTSLLEVFQCIPEFQAQDDHKRLCKYLTNEEFIPDCVYEQWGDFHKALKQFASRFQACIAHIKEDWTVYKMDQTKDRTLYYQFQNYCACYHEFFSSTDEGVNISGDLQFELNWRRIDDYLMGEVFSHVFNIDNIPTKVKVTDARKCLLYIKDLLEWNLQHCPDYAGRKAKTCLAMITVTMALHSPYREVNYTPKLAKLAQEYRATYQLLQKYAAVESQSGSAHIYSYLFKMMFHWPRDDIEIPNYQPEEYDNVIEVLRQKFSARTRSIAPLDQHLYPKFTRRPKVRVGTTLFYLGKGSGLDVFVHVNELPRTKSEQWGNKQVNWKHPYIKQRLRRLDGRRENIRTIGLRHPLCSDKFLNVSCIQQKSFTREDVTFYLGFCWSGLIALDIKGALEEESTSSPGQYHGTAIPLNPRRHQETESDTEELPFRPCTFTEYRRRMKKLDRKLAEITTLESLRTLDETQKRKVRSKSELLREKKDLMDAFSKEDDFSE